MSPDRNDMAYLWDMLDSARAAVGFCQSRNYDDLMSDRMFRNAVERCLEIIGEAARRVSAETQDSLPDIPWRSVIGLRNVLAHEYDEIRHEILWNICKNELPLLIQQIEATGADIPPPMDCDGGTES